MPAYPCGDADCDECLRAFGRERVARSAAAQRKREAYYASLDAQAAETKPVSKREAA